MSMFEMEQTHEVSIARRLGVRNLRWWDKISYGGGASCATHHARRARRSRAAWRRPWSAIARAIAAPRRHGRGRRRRAACSTTRPCTSPWGLIRPVDVIGMWAHRHMHEYGTTREHFGNVAIAARAARAAQPVRDDARPSARHGDLSRTRASIGYPLHLYDCCLETDGALACVVTSIERARDLRQQPALVHAVAQASGPNPVHLANYNNAPSMQTTSAPCAELLWSRSELQPRTWTARRSTTPSRRW